MTRSALIVGAGIGGLTAALALAEHGWTVRVLERRKTPGEAGAGIQQSPNAMRVHRALGTEEAIRAAAFAPDAAVIRDGLSGRDRVGISLGQAAEARYGAPYLLIHRADLHGVILRAVLAAGISVETGASVRGYEPVGRVLTAEGPVSADLIVAADGVRSAVRTQMHPGAEARFTGNVAWRATVPSAGLPEEALRPEAASWTGPGGHVVTYPLRGGTVLNVVAVRERSAWAAEGWTAPGDADEMRAAFVGWAPAVRAVLEAVGTTNLWGLFDHAPLPRWSDGVVTLLGDAAHPMLPFMAQGAAMAVEDAWVLARSVTEAADVASGLAGYEALRRPRTAKLQAMSRANADLFHRRGLGPIKLAVGAALPGLPARQMAGVFGHDVTAMG